MDTTPIDFDIRAVLGSVPAIVALVMFAINRLKAWAATTPLGKLPIYVYACGISAALTALGYYLGYMQGDLFSLIQSAIVTAGAASGIREWFVNGNKPLEESAMARRVASTTSSYRHLTVLALAVCVSLSIACGGRAAQIAVTADDTAFARLEQIKLTKDTHCDAGNIPASACVSLAKAFVPVWDGYLAFNRALASGTPIEKADATVASVKAAARTFMDEVNRLQEGEWKRILTDLVASLIARL